MLNISDKEFKALAEFIKKNYGINLNENKKELVISRLYSVLLENGFKTYSQYYKYIVSDRTGKAIITLLDKITTNHTFFMREKEHFHYFKEYILPYLKDTIKSKDIYVWSAGCATGEEPYTLAMIIADYFGKEKIGWNTKILATDISTKALENALHGVYGNEQMEPIPVNWKKNYFRSFNEEKSVIAEEIKKEVIYRRFNLMNEIFPFKKNFHVIFCRNVMIYFDAKTKKDLVNKLYEYTNPGGYLFIGHTESINREETKYKYIRPGVYRKE